MILAVTRKIFTSVFFIVISYFLFQFGISDINSQAIINDTPPPLLAYQSDNEFLSSDALVKKAESNIQDSPEISKALAFKALSYNHSSGRAAAFLLGLFEKQGNSSDADNIANLASDLWPAHSYTRSKLADYWLKRNRPDKLIHEWNVLLNRKGILGLQLFPVMRAFLENDELAPLISPYINQPPSWWNGFFGYLSRNLELERFIQLYQNRIMSEVPLSKLEQNNYINRLIRERLWEEAHSSWFAGLSLNQMSFSGLIYDGGFESNIFNQGFGWNFTKSKFLEIRPNITYGIKGRKALQVNIQKQKPFSFSHVWQRLLLTPGTYSFKGRYRADTFKANKGLSWRIYCIEEGGRLGESQPIKGSRSWSALSFDFTVTETCTIQLLRLESTSAYIHNQSYKGSVWFDSLQINAVKSGDVLE